MLPTRVAAKMARALTAVAIAGVAGLAAPSPPASAAMSRDEVKAEVEKTYGVAVLRMKETEIDGKPALAVTVMNKGGNDNRAFQVNTLLVNPDTGHLVPVYRALPDGYQLPEILESDPNKQPSDLLATRDAHPWR